MTENTQESRKPNNAVQLVVIGVLVVGAFFGAYKFASARNGAASAPVADNIQATAPVTGDSAAAGTPACACCGSSEPTAEGVTGAPVEGTAQVAGGVQAISVDVNGTYSPNVIKLKSGVPAEITFGQSSGCTAQVVSTELGFSEDLSTGPKVVKLPALDKGTYEFTCGMRMVFGKIVVE